jgi:CRP/FNR family transcriptional regulator, cyclic AMP receptor protein
MAGARGPSRGQDPLCNLGKMETLRLAAIRFFAGLPEDELAAVASMASEEEIPAGQALAAEGRAGYSLYAIESGTADVVINGETVGTIGAGDVVGEIAVLIAPPDWSAPPEVAIGGSRTASVVATSPMRLITLYKRDVWALNRRAPVMTQRLRALLDERRAKDAERALGDQRAPSEQGGSPGSDPPAGHA